MFNAYTAKKIIPRLLIAMVLIQLSWFIFTGLIQITNGIAYGIEGLILQPFKTSDGLPTLGDAITKLLGGNGWAGFGSLVAGGAAGTAVVIMNLGAILPIAGMALVSLLVGFFVLILRQMVLVGLLVVVPLALVAWILPGTERWWKLWWENFSKLLIMYPMILGMVAAGRAFAIIIAGL